MPTQEERMNAVEGTIAVMRRDIIYKLDETNSAVTVVKGVVGAIGQDTTVIQSQLKTMDLRLDGLNMRLNSVVEQQGLQSQDIKDIKHRLDDQDKKLDQILQQLAILTSKSES